ncbi:MAG: ABC transporter ATP-binding protein [Actinomycetota bacterium]|nr:ABC transporter ATP-binding protein [Actinomycetota bacterium]
MTSTEPDTPTRDRDLVRDGAPSTDDGAGGAEPPVVSVRSLVKRFRRADGTVVRAIDDVTFTVRRGEMVVLVGPSGCGKTTLLRSIAGLERPDGGTIEIGGSACYASDAGVFVPPERRRVSMVFQNYALWPHMTALENVVYPLRSDRRRRMRKAEAGRRARDVLGLVGVGDICDQHPHQMSGGQRQRVALARALVADTDLVLFDEPLSNVDAKVRSQLRLELLSMQRALGFSALFVTHDQAEAMELAHRLAVLGHGRIDQLGTPAEVYRAPRSAYVARFIGSANEVAGRVEAIDDDGTVRVTTPIGEVHGRADTAAVEVGDEVAAMWRPEHTALVADRPSTSNRWPATVETSLFLGPYTEQVVDVAGRRFVAWSTHAPATDEGSSWLGVEAADVLVLPAGPGDATSDEPPAD